MGGVIVNSPPLGSGEGLTHVLCQGTSDSTSTAPTGDDCEEPIRVEFTSYVLQNTDFYPHNCGFSRSAGELQAFSVELFS